MSPEKITKEIPRREAVSEAFHPKDQLKELESMITTDITRLEQLLEKGKLADAQAELQHAKANITHFRQWIGKYQENLIKKGVSAREIQGLVEQIRQNLEDKSYKEMFTALMGGDDAAYTYNLSLEDENLDADDLADLASLDVFPVDKSVAEEAGSQEDREERVGEKLAWLNEKKLLKDSIILLKSRERRLIKNIEVKDGNVELTMQVLTDGGELSEQTFSVTQLMEQKDAIDSVIADGDENYNQELDFFEDLEGDIPETTREHDVDRWVELFKKQDIQTLIKNRLTETTKPEMTNNFNTHLIAKLKNCPHITIGKEKWALRVDSNGYIHLSFRKGRLKKDSEMKFRAGEFITYLKDKQFTISEFISDKDSSQEIRGTVDKFIASMTQPEQIIYYLNNPSTLANIDASVSSVGFKGAGRIERSEETLADLEKNKAKYLNAMRERLRVVHADSSVDELFSSLQKMLSAQKKSPSEQESSIYAENNVVLQNLIGEKMKDIKISKKNHVDAFRSVQISGRKVYVHFGNKQYSVKEVLKLIENQ